MISIEPRQAMPNKLEVGKSIFSRNRQNRKQNHIAADFCNQDKTIQNNFLSISLEKESFCGEHAFCVLLPWKVFLFLPVIFRMEETKNFLKKADRTSVRKKRIAFGVETFKMVLQQYPMINMGLGLLTNPR